MCLNLLRTDGVINRASRRMQLWAQEGNSFVGKWRQEVGVLRWAVPTWICDPMATVAVAWELLGL